MSERIPPGISRVPEALLDDLRTRLHQTRWPAAVEGQGWSRGVDLDYLRQLVDYWRSGFDWRVQESALGRFTRSTSAQRIQTHLLLSCYTAGLTRSCATPRCCLCWTVSIVSCLLFQA